MVSCQLLCRPINFEDNGVHDDNAPKLIGLLIWCDRKDGFDRDDSEDDSENCQRQ